MSIFTPAPRASEEVHSRDVTSKYSEIGPAVDADAGVIGPHLDAVLVTAEGPRTSYSGSGAQQRLHGRGMRVQPFSQIHPLLLHSDRLDQQIAEF